MKGNSSVVVESRDKGPIGWWRSAAALTADAEVEVYRVCRICRQYFPMPSILTHDSANACWSISSISSHFDDRSIKSRCGRHFQPNNVVPHKHEIGQSQPNAVIKPLRLTRWYLTVHGVYFACIVVWAQSALEKVMHRNMEQVNVDNSITGAFVCTAIMYKVSPLLASRIVRPSQAREDGDSHHFSLQTS